MTEKDLLYSVKDHIAHITINREKYRNSISAEAVDLFRQYLDQAEKDDAVRVICVTGAGEKAFCSGADLGGAMSAEGEGKNQAFRNYADLLKRLAGYSKPTVARINGYCLAGGTGFMLACDIVIARNDAKFGTPEVNVGLFPMMIGALIFRNVLKKKAMEMVLLGEKLGAAQAQEMGLITRSVAPEKLDETVNKILESLAAKSPIGMKIGKQSFYAMQDLGFEEALDFLSEKLSEVASTEDAVEGITAFIEKRAPVFKGK
ncbi:MAG: enoyl-CoA hydratase [Desulfobacteraceae bacterium]|nr:enoyl-CoA hydratase/isomerase family protein [Desulfobacteraceae bacterium]MBC2756964.1 enoyl-CoA hydratase [Desulfobacteraceae bacterium]